MHAAPSSTLTWDPIPFSREGSSAEHPPLQAGTVHLWLADLAALGEDAINGLSAEEHSRARRFVSPDAGRLWARSRGTLRRLLGSYVGRDGASLRIGTTEHGKPILHPDSSPEVHFNLSHSGSLALYAFSAAGEVGVDLEAVPRQVDELAIATRAFGQDEVRRLESCSPPERRYEFLRAWVRYEAAVKYRGAGLGETRPGDVATAPWTADLEVRGEGAAAVAVAGRPGELIAWRLTGL